MLSEPLSSPLFEFDASPRAFIEPSETVERRDVPPACVVTFFGDAVHRLVDSGRARVIVDNAWEDGPHPLLSLEHEGRPTAILHSGVGAPLSAGLLEQVIAMGCRAFVVCGGAGALDPGLTRGHLVVVESALRDEGTSHHYASASRYIDADPTATTVLTDTLIEHEVPFVAGRTWTTDAPYRETPAKIAARRQEGCITVDMEAAALAAVAAFRGLPLAQVLYAGDDLSGEQWDHRSWRTQAQVRDNLLMLAASAAVRLAN
jgi:uridine phosphorylase